MSKKNGIVFSKPAEPAFLTAFKKKAGFKEGPTVHTKREELGLDESQEDKEDELPTVVVLKDGDLSQEQARDAIDQGAQQVEENDDEDIPKDGRIRFRKPKKRKSEESQDPEEKHKNSSSKKVKNTALLSFNEDEEDV